MIARLVRTEQAKSFIRIYHYIIKYDNAPPVELLISTNLAFRGYLQKLKQKIPKSERDEMLKLIAEIVKDDQ